MSKNKIINKISSTVSKAGFSLKQHSPEILVVVGIGGVIASTVMACIATTKLNDVIETPKKELDKIHKLSSGECETQSGEPYTNEMAKKDTTRIYFKAGFDIARLYLPAVTIGIFSLSSIVASNNMLRKRNIALASAYAAIDRSFKEYRERVINRFGKDIDTQLYLNAIPVEVEKEVTDEDGNTTLVKETVYQFSDEGLGSSYARLFDETNPEWRADAAYNQMWLLAKQNYFNDLLKVRKFVFLNEVYKELGFQETKAGQIVGWKYDENNSTGDNYIDFGILNAADPKVRDFMNGAENCVIINPNVDGDILTDFNNIISAY